MIKLVSVDDRLLHGQIAFFWTQYLKLNKIIILNTEAANDEFTRMVLELAKPKNVDLVISELEKGYDLVERELNQNESSVLVILGNLFDANKLIEHFIYQINHLNIGGLRVRPNSKQIDDRTSLTIEDISIIKKLINNNVTVTVRTSPKDKEIRLTIDKIMNL